MSLNLKQTCAPPFLRKLPLEVRDDIDLFERLTHTEHMYSKCAQGSSLKDSLEAFFGVEEERDWAIIDEAHLHVRSKSPGLYLQTFTL